MLSLCFSSLGMKDSWGPLKALAAASVINAVGDIVLCMFLGYGIAGAAWATMVSQVCGINFLWYVMLYMNPLILSYCCFCSPELTQFITRSIFLLP